MLVDKEWYSESLKDASYEELIHERNVLIKELHIFENNRETISLFNVDPSPDVVYQCNNEYLIEVSKLINAKFKNRKM